MKTTLTKLTCSIISAAFVLGGFTAHAASQTWTNAPVSAVWTNVANWVGGAYPGAINMTGNTVNGDVATFNTPIPVSGYGGAASPITTADSTISGDRALQISGITFDTTNCGAYVFQGNSPINYSLEYGLLNVSHNGSITMNAPVTNNQTFIVPVFIRLPSSTAGIYNFVNNSTNAATLWFSAITNDSANTRGTVFTLGGSNTGTNTIGYLSKGTTTSGAMGFTKQGTGLWILQNYGGSDFPKQAAINVNDGTLQVLDPGCWGLATPVTVSSNAVEQLINVGQTNTTLNGNGTVQVKGSGTLASITVSAAVNVTPHLVTTSPSDVLTVGISGVTATAVTAGSATSVIHIGGPGIVLLETNSSYIGNWSVDSGVLQVGATYALGTNAVNVNVAAGGTLDLTPLGAGVTFNPSGAGIGGSGTGTTVGSTAATIKPDAAGTLDLATGSKNISLTYHPTSFTGDASHPALYISQGTLNLGGNTITVNNASGTPLGAGTYLLIQQATGNINNAGNLAANVTGSGVVAGDVGTIQVSGGQVSLVVAVYVSKNLIWQGGNPNDNWDVNTTANWLNGGSLSVFNNSDNVIFNSVGASNPIVNIVGAVLPTSVLVDTTATNYVFSGSGSISGDTGLTKMGLGTLVVSNANSYLGITVVSNGTVQLGKANGLSGNSDVTISNIAIVDLNSFNVAIGALNGGGTVDTVAGGTPVLTVGNNADSGTFSGTIKNTAGTLALTKANTGIETLAGANTYAGATTVNAGTLRVANVNALGSGNSAVTLNSGTTLDVSTNVVISTIAGVGTVENNSTTSTNLMTFSGTSTFTGAILDGSGGGGISVLINSGVFEFAGVSTYSGGSIVASGAELEISGGDEAGAGGIIVSNNSTLGMPTATSSSATFGNTITTVNNAQVMFTSGETANSWGGQFVGGITSTNIFANGNMSISGALSFSNFLGTVIVTNGEVRGFNASEGGDNTTFIFENAGGWFVRDNGDTMHLGALWGDPTAVITAPSVSWPGDYVIGGANLNSTYSGTISGSNNIVKIGTGTLTLDGGNDYTTNVTFNGVFYTTNIGTAGDLLTYIGSTTVSNGVLALVGPGVLTNSTPVTLASLTAVLDANSLGYVTNLMDNPLPDGGTNEVVTNSIYELVVGNTLSGVGTLRGNLQADTGSIFDVGLPSGTFNVTSNASLAGSVVMSLDSTNGFGTNSELVAKTITISPSATLLVTNTGPGLINGSTFVLFNHPVSFTPTVILPATDPTGTTNYVWANNLTSNGSITLTSGGVAPPPATPPTVGYSINGNTLTLSWPSSYLGYVLQVQTNSLSVGVSTNWVNVPNSASVTSTNITINPQNPTVFFRLVQ